MPKHRLIVRIALKLFAIAVIALPFATQVPANASEKNLPHSGKHKGAVKISPHRVGKVTKPKKVLPRPHKATVQKRSAPKKADLKQSPASLKLARNIEPTAPAASARPAQAARSVNPDNAKAFQSDPPLLIGKTLYQRNGEMRHFEGQQSAND